MKLILIISIICLLVTINQAKPTLKSKPFIKTYQSTKIDELKNGTYLTKVDHFNPRNKNDRVRFPYLFNDEFFEYGGPIFVYINDAGAVTTEWIEHGLMYDIAESHKALMLTTDYRYFGENIPTPSASFDDLAFLTVEQTLADIAFFVNHVKQEFQTPYSRVILWGSGDGGTMAVLARQKFPHLITGAWSSSGAFALDVITYEPFEYLSNIIRENNDECAENVEEAFVGIQELVVANNGAQLQQLLHLCQPLDTNSEAAVAFFYTQQIAFIANYINQLHNDGLNDFCNDMTSDENGLIAFSAWLRQSQPEPCLTVPYDYYIGMGNQQQWGEPGTMYGLRQGYYFLCTQFGMFTLTSNNTLFGDRVPQSFHYNMCHDVLGEQYQSSLLVESIAAIGSAYGGRNPNPTNSIFTNGELDLWFNHGIHEVPQENENAIVWNIPDYGKSSDLTSISDEDTPHLRQVKESIEKTINSILEIHV